MSSHQWVNKYQECPQCNYDSHTCYFCGAYLDHESYDTDGNLHDVAFCRPDLVEHEPGPTCTWAFLDPPNCYWDHVNNRLKENW